MSISRYFGNRPVSALMGAIVLFFASRPYGSLAAPEVEIKSSWASGAITNVMNLPGAPIFGSNPSIIPIESGTYVVVPLPFGDFSIGEVRVSTARGQTGSFVGKFDRRGALEWYKIVGNGSNLRLFGCGPDRDGNLTVAGSFDSGMVLMENGVTFEHADQFSIGRDFIVAKYSPAGNLLWVKGTQNEEGMAIAAVTQDQQDNIFVFAFGPFRFQHLTVSTMTSSLLKLNSNGVPAWVKSHRAGGPYAAATQTNGTIAFAAIGSGVFKQVTYPSGALVFGRFSASGEELSVSALTGPQTIWADYLALDGAGNGLLAATSRGKVVPTNVRVAGGVSGPDGGPLLIGIEAGRFKWIRFDLWGKIACHNGEYFLLGDRIPQRGVPGIYKIALTGEAQLHAAIPQAMDQAYYGIPDRFFFSMHSPADIFVWIRGQQHMEALALGLGAVPPHLRIERIGEETTINWSAADGFILETTPGLVSGAWAPVSNGNRSPVLIPDLSERPQAFYRLRKALP